MQGRGPCTASLRQPFLTQPLHVRDVSGLSYSAIEVSVGLDSYERHPRSCVLWGLRRRGFVLKRDEMRCPQGSSTQLPTALLQRLVLSPAPGLHQPLPWVTCGVSRFFPIPQLWRLVQPVASGSGSITRRCLPMDKAHRTPLQGCLGWCWSRGSGGC